jgi:predicted ATP-grasp superfamily ATP-dependent carboligase
MTVFVTDGDQRPALAITRSLGRRGLFVIVGEERRDSLAAASRYCARQITYPSPYRTPDAFDRFVQDLVTREQIDVVVPVTDVTTAAIAGLQDSLRGRCAMSVPAFDAFDLAADKRRLLQQAVRCGIDVPRTESVDNAGQLSQVLPRVTYPAVVKPARSRIRTPNGWLSTSVAVAHDAEALGRLYEEREDLGRYPSLIQEYVSGAGVGVFALCDRGEVLATFSHVRVREKPPSGGVSVLCESQPIDPALESQARRLLGALGWHGVAMLEYKRDRHTGRAALMEINGRFWGSLQLAIDAGVDFPYLSHQLALGQPIDAPSSYRAGVRSRWWLGDVDHLLARWFGDNSNLPVGAPSRWQATLAFIAPVRNGRSEVWRFEDLRPGLRELGRYTQDLGRGLVRRTQRARTRLAQGSAGRSPRLHCEGAQRLSRTNGAGRKGPRE